MVNLLYMIQNIINLASEKNVKDELKEFNVLMCKLHRRELVEIKQSADLLERLRHLERFLVFTYGDNKGVTIDINTLANIENVDIIFHETEPDYVYKPSSNVRKLSLLGDFLAIKFLQENISDLQEDEIKKLFNRIPVLRSKSFDMLFNNLETRKISITAQKNLSYMKQRFKDMLNYDQEISFFLPDSKSNEHYYHISLYYAMCESELFAKLYNELQTNWGTMTVSKVAPFSMSYMLTSALKITGYTADEVLYDVMKYFKYN